MADLEDMLMEAAGRSGAPGRSRHSRPPSAYLDDGSDSKDDDSEDEPRYASRKSSVSHVPLKKRLDPSEKDGGEGDHEGSSSDESDVGSDLYKDDSDKEQLANMTELEREMILAERAQKRDDQRLTERVRAKQSVKKTRIEKETPRPAPHISRVRSSTRSAGIAAAKGDALNELRAKRLKQQDPEGHWKSRDSSSRGRNSSPIRRKPASPSNDTSQSESQSGSHTGGGDADMGDSDEEKPMGKDTPTFDDIKAVTIRRTKLAKLFMEPFFEELIVGCFVRVGIGRRNKENVYRLCMVGNVDATDPDRQYKLENKSTYKFLNLVFGKSEARWQMDKVSDSPPLEKEYNQWLHEVTTTKARMPTQDDVREKREAIILKTNTFVYSAATVKQMLQEKKSASSRPFNIASEKDTLRRQLEVAQSRKDNVEVERIQARLQELDALSRQAKEKDTKAVRLAEMNKRNKAENFKAAFEVKALNPGLKAGDAGHDPFSRRWTRSRNYYVPNSNGGEGGEESAAALLNGAAAAVPKIGLTVGSMVATAGALEAAASAGKLVDTNAPVDQGTESNSLHNFNLPISLAELQRFGGAQGAHLGFMARKQRIEATIGCRVPEDDGRRHTLTLSVSDYKRRRGLL
ncbi:hypothetical protein GIB67_033874 [Kingdonia uniflora]|uniref:Plus3 domain-containing protein n=1 Tax=Kingdonia uniflora TaxID=39325 RepID=A0A7J7MIU1_9MAGN|nr:hypothetical protein GIB67_033874 [Kingdonia uniflora]